VGYEKDQYLLFISINISLLFLLGILRTSTDQLLCGISSAARDDGAV
jgi:hypothetical protein